VTTFEILVSEVNFFKRKYVWTTIIVDEGHRLKNEKSQLSEKLRSVSCLSKIILTGTPLQNNLRELWALLHFLASDVFTPATAERFETGFDLVKGLVDSKLLRRARRLLGVSIEERTDSLSASNQETGRVVQEIALWTGQRCYRNCHEREPYKRSCDSIG
jgi:SWI/SNF-related matrix-associated actin-dependent regulator of chromatin subfamily A member 5